MCVDIVDERSADRWIEELKRTYANHKPLQQAVVRRNIEAFQRGRGWLLDYDLETLVRVTRKELVAA